MVDKDYRADLTNELHDLITVHLAAVMVPALRALGIAGYTDLGATLRRYAGDLMPKLEDVVSRYEVRKPNEWDGSKQV